MIYPLPMWISRLAISHTPGRPLDFEGKALFIKYHQIKCTAGWKYIVNRKQWLFSLQAIKRRQTKNVQPLTAVQDHCELLHSKIHVILVLNQWFRCIKTDAECSCRR